MNVPSQVSQLIPLDHDLTIPVVTDYKSREALLKIFDLHASTIYNYALVLYGSSLIADHIVGGVFAKLSEDLSAGKALRSNLRLHLYGITYRLLVDEMNFADRPAQIDFLPYREIYRGHTQLTAEERPYVEAVQHALRYSLKKDQQHVVLLRFVAGLRVKETAAIMGKTVVNIRVIQNRAMAVLREVLGDPMGEISKISFLIARLSGT